MEYIYEESIFSSFSLKKEEWNSKISLLTYSTVFSIYSTMTS